MSLTQTFRYNQKYQFKMKGNSNSNTIEVVIINTQNMKRSFYKKPESKIIDFKNEIGKVYGMKSNVIQLISGGKPLKDTETLAFYNIQNKNAVHMIKSFLGGVGL